MRLPVSGLLSKIDPTKQSAVKGSRATTQPRLMPKCASSMARSRDAILREIARVDAALAESERQRDEMRVRLEGLRAELAVPSSPTPSIVTADSNAPQTPAEKVRLFRPLFRGRADIFPVRFVSKKTNRAGYCHVVNG